jgi:hypothetical protein
MKPFESLPAFRQVLSLESLFAYWKAKEGDPNPVVAGLAQDIGQLASAHPELAAPTLDPATVHRYERELGLLWSTLIPAAALDSEIIAVTLPFDMVPVYASGPYKAMMASKADHHAGDLKTGHEILLATWRFALAQLYGLEGGLPPAPVFEMPGPDGLPRFNRIDINLNFCRVVPVGPLPELTPELRRDLADAGNDPGRLATLLPPSLFEFRGLVVMRAIDVTDLEIVSRLKYLLIGDQALTNPANYRAVVDLVRAALRKPRLELHLVAFRGDQVIMLQQELLTGEDCILSSQNFGSLDSFEGTVFGRTRTENRPFALTELTADIDDRHLQEAYAEGARSLLTLPLTAGSQMVGMGVLASPDPCGVSSVDLDGLAEILPLLALGVRRALDTLDRQVQQIIQKTWTSIHPAVAWKFEAEATQALIGGAQAMKPIVFENVSPLYAVSDIRNSSVHRSQAILSDLNRQLELGLHVVQSARRDRPLPLLDEMEYRIGLQRGLLSDGLNTGDEISVMNFLKRGLEPLFDDLAAAGAGTKALVEEYRRHLHADAHSLYERRRDFDESVARLNRTISDYLDEAQSGIQKVFPHYFDKTTTDGVDHTIYVGASLVRDGRFDPLYLQNLKLWQYMTLCQVARLTARLAPQLAVPLEMTHLIMVQDLPITIRFNNDEKRFAVDGAYNIRYEIMKKRIDKAVVKSTGERLTQPGRIAIVYSQDDESHDYRRYTGFLTAQGWLEPGVEELELEDLQGIHGLKALRVKVKVDEVAVPTPSEVSDIASRRRRTGVRTRA